MRTARIAIPLSAAPQFPFIGATTPMCLLLLAASGAAGEPANVPIVMALNLALAVPSVLCIPLFVKAGSWLCGGEVGLDMAGLSGAMERGIAEAVRVYGVALLQGFLAWGLYAVCVVAVARTALVAPLARMRAKPQRRGPSPAAEATKL